MKNNIYIFTILFTLLSTNIFADNIHYGVFYEKYKYKYYGNPIGSDSEFYSDNIKNTLSNFQINTKYESIDSKGVRRNISIDYISKEIQGALGETLFQANIQDSKLLLPIIFWTSGKKRHEFVESKEVHIPKHNLFNLEKRIYKLYEKALSSLRFKGRKIYEIKEPIVRVALGSNFAFINFPITLLRENSSYDKRASASFIYNIKTKEIITEYFGHPEWSSGNNESIKSINPIFFLNIDGVLHAFSRYTEAWEYSGYALVQVSDGKLIEISY